MPLLTEVALGRATDHLFDALPKALRRELAALPQTVRRLEVDAGKLRQSIDALDGQLAVFDRGGETLVDHERDGVADSLRSARSLATERLSATVAAIENIRLDLLRLQMGSAGIESVTASLDAARLIGDRISDSVDAQEQVERLLRSPGPTVRHEHAADAVDEQDVDEDVDDDADTPTNGVPAVHV